MANYALTRPTPAHVKVKGVFLSLDDPQSGSNGSFFRRIGRFLGFSDGPSMIQEYLDEVEERGLIDEEEGEMIEGIVDLRQMVTREIMIPRTHIVALNVDATREEILNTVVHSGHSRIPIFRDSVDYIVGILNARDLLPLWLEGETEVDLEKIVREPYFVPETKRVRDLLDELRTKKSHMAIIVDEYGGTAGIVTMEDIVEEIVGEIQDEHDVEEELFLPADDEYSLLVNARTPLPDFEERFNVKIPREGYDTLGGFIIHLMGKVPDVGEEISYEDLLITVHSGDCKRVTHLKVSKDASPEAAPVGIS